MGMWEEQHFVKGQHTLFVCYAIALQLGQSQGAYKNVAWYIWLPLPLQSKILLGGQAIKEYEFKKN